MTSEAAPRTDGNALIAHTRSQVRTVLNLLESLEGLWALQTCPDPLAHGEAEAAAGTALDAYRVLYDYEHLPATQFDEKYPDWEAKVARLAGEDSKKPASGGLPPTPAGSGRV